MTAEEMELVERLDLMQRMIDQGRQSTQRWGWTFLTWGVAYYVAIAWSVYGQTWFAWPVTMIAASIFTGVRASRGKRNQPNTTIGRALSAVWVVTGIALFVVLMSAGMSGRADLHMAVTIAGALLAVANGISSFILRWKLQFVCALAWLATAVSACFTNDIATEVISLAAIFLCQIVFGAYMMVLESRRRGRGAVHA